MKNSKEEKMRLTRIRALNDQLRQNLEGGRIMLTAGIDALPEAKRLGVFSRVIAFKDFNESNDPYHEHDFGAFRYWQKDIFWKIDYYNLDGHHGSPDPSDPNVTLRVLTVMLASEY